MNKRMIIKMCINPHIIKTFLNLHCQFRKHEDYKVRNMVKCGLNIIINDHLVQHDGYYLVNSFIPPINTNGISTLSFISFNVSNETLFASNFVLVENIAPIPR